LRSSQLPQRAIGATPIKGAVRLVWLIRVLRLIWGTGMHRIDRETRIHRRNVADGVNVLVAGLRTWYQRQIPCHSRVSSAYSMMRKLLRKIRL
jgi:hypothetical protein